MAQRRTLGLLWIGLAAVWTHSVIRPSESFGFTVGRPAQEIAGGPWINSRPLSLNDLKGRVVLVEFWTYG